MAAHPIFMPRLGMSMQEGTVVEWTVGLQAATTRGETVLIIESEKAEVEVEAGATGFFRHVYVDPGETVPCGTLLGAITDTADEPFDAEALAAEHPVPDAPEPAATTAPAAAVVGTEPKARPGRGPAVAPAARALARKLDIDPTQIQGTGPGGRILRQDVEAHAAARERLVGVSDGVGLEVLREGTGEPVLLLPGFGSDVSSFALQTPALAESFEVVGLNPRGVGHSDAAPDTGWSVEAMARDAAEVLGQLDLASAHVVGASLGAAVAMELAIAHPERVRSLTLITPFLRASARLAAVANAWQRVAAQTSSETLAHFLAPWLFSDALLADNARRERTLRGLSASLGRIPPTTLQSTALGMAAWSGSCVSELGALKIPTLVLVAGDDLLTPDAAAVADAIGSAHCVEIPDTGHALGIEAPEAVNLALREHLAAAVSGAS